MPGLWTMQGFGRRSTRTSSCRSRTAPRCPDETRPGSTGARSRVPKGWRRRPVVLHFGAARACSTCWSTAQPVGIAKDARTPAEFDVSEHVHFDASNVAAGGGGALVGRELRRGPGPVVARRPAALDPAIPSVGDIDVSRGTRRRSRTGTGPCTPMSTATSACSTPAAGSFAAARAVEGTVRRPRAVVGRGAVPVHARARDRRRDRLVRGRLPLGRGARRTAARQRPSRC